MVCVRLVGRCGRAGYGRGARASVEASRPVAASGLGPPASGPVDADAADARATVHTQAVHTVAITWYCVVSQIVQRPEGARCVQLHRFAIAPADQPAIYFLVDRIAARRGALQTAIGEATEGSHSNL